MPSYYHSDGTPCSKYCRILTIQNSMAKGLDNLGNTCFLNSSLQLLASSNHFIECLCSCLYEIQQDEEDSLSHQCSFLCELANVIKDVTYNPEIFTTHVNHFYEEFIKDAPVFGDEDQHDASETIQTILELVEKDINKINEHHEKASIFLESVEEIVDQDKSKTLSNTKDHLITLPTNGMLCDVMMCSRCGSRRQITNTKFFSLTLPISKTPWWRLDPTCRKNYYSLFKTFNLYSDCSLPVNTTLLDCLREFTAADEIEGVNCKGCGVLNSLLDPSSLPDHLSSPQRDEIETCLKQGLHKVRSSHDLTEDLHIQQDTLSIPIQEAKGYFRKYELIGRPPKTLIFQLQRKLALWNPLLSKQNDFVDIPQILDLREFCFFSQSVPSTHLNEGRENEEKREERRLRRINSWKEGLNVSEDRIAEMNDYFEERRREPRKRCSSFDSTCSDYSDVYEIDNEDMLFSEEEMERSEMEERKEEMDIHVTQEKEILEQQPTLVEDALSYNPYIRQDNKRGGGDPLLYKLTAVIQHMGGGCGGHYICYRKVRQNGKEVWMMFNDEYVKEVTWKNVNTKDVYIVNYELL